MRDVEYLELFVFLFFFFFPLCFSINEKIDSKSSRYRQMKEMNSAWYVKNDQHNDSALMGETLIFMFHMQVFANIISQSVRNTKKIDKIYKNNETDGERERELRCQIRARIARPLLFFFLSIVWQISLQQISNITRATVCSFRGQPRFRDFRKCMCAKYRPIDTRSILCSKRVATTHATLH